MKINIFLRSTLRQPVRAVFLLIITALLTFVFVSSGTQYLLINQETEELGSYYRSIGTLTARDAGTNWTTDASEAAAYLEDSPYMEYVNRAQLASAVADVYNAYTNTPDPTTMSADFYFYGTFVSGSLVRQVPAGSGTLLPDETYDTSILLSRRYPTWYSAWLTVCWNWPVSQRRPEKGTNTAAAKYPSKTYYLLKNSCEIHGFRRNFVWLLYFLG